MWYVTVSVHASGNTKRDNGLSALLPRAPTLETASVRGAATLLRRWALLQGSRRGIRLHRGLIRCAVHHFRRDGARVLPHPDAGSAEPAEEVRRARQSSTCANAHSVYEIAEALKEQGTALSATAVREVLRELGFAALPRRLDEERPDLPRPTVESTADARVLNLSPRRFPTRCGGLFLFVPDLVRLGLEQMADTARLPGSKMIPRTTRFAPVSRSSCGPSSARATSARRRRGVGAVLR